MTTPSPKIAIVANGPSQGAADTRGRRIEQALRSHADVLSLNRTGSRLIDTCRLAQRLRRFRPDVTYLVDLGVAPLTAWLLAGRPGRLVLDTGDAPRDFLELISAGKLRVNAARLLEHVGYGQAVSIVVRGPFHRQSLLRRGYRDVSIVPDGVDLELFAPRSATALRSKLGLADAYVLGLQGNFTWYPELGGGLGWEAVTALGHLTDLPIHLLLIGDGPGVAELRQLAATLDVADRLHALGRVELSTLPNYLALSDVFLLTQTNDPSSWIRTTGKLPCYLAMGRPIIASAVGTATQVLPPEFLVEYIGTWDTTYPKRLAERIRALHADPYSSELGATMRTLATCFDYETVARQAANIALSAVS